MHSICIHRHVKDGSAWNIRVRCSDLPPIAKLIALTLYACSRDSAGANQSQSELMAMTSLSKSALNKHLNILESCGWISRERVGSAKITEYKLIHPKLHNHTEVLS